MADKQLTESAWKTFAKGKAYKDAALLKALAALDKADKAGPEAVLKALDEIDKEADQLRKAGKGDKELASHLDGIDKAAAKDRKTAEADLADAKAESQAEEEDSPALLTTKLVPLLRQVRKGDTVLQALIAVVGKDTAVLLSRKAISPVRGKLLKEYLGATGAIKFIRGECIFEANAHTFVVQSQAAGLAKKLKAALMAQTEMRVKVRVRGEDPADIDDDGDDAPPDDEDQGSNKPGATTDQKGGEPRTKDTGNADTAAARALAAYESKLADLQPRLRQAATGPLAAKLEQLLSLARGKAAAGQVASAMEVLAAVQQQLDSAAAAQAAASGDAGVDPGAAFNARLTALMPKIKQALALGGEQAPVVKAKTAEAGVLAQKRDHVQAQARLDEVEALLGAQTDAKAAQASDQARAEHEALRAALQDDYDAAMAGRADPAWAELRATAQRAWDLAEEAAADGTFQRAALILKRLADGGVLNRILQARQQTDTGGTVGAGAKPNPKSLLAQRTFLLTQWPVLTGTLHADLNRARAELQSSGDDDDPDQLFDDIDDYVDDLLDTLQDRIDDAINSGAPDGLRSVLSTVENEPLLKLMDTSPLPAVANLKATLLATVREVADRMARAPA